MGRSASRAGVQGSTEIPAIAEDMYLERVVNTVEMGDDQGENGSK